MKRIAITGGIGSGKSVVSHLLRVMGYPVYDTDTEARRMMESSCNIREQVSATFGADVYVDGVLNRPLLAGRVFPYPRQISRLNAIVHPAVCNDFGQWSRRQDGEVCFVESAILYESHLDQWVDSVWLVSAPEAMRIERVKRRSRLTDSEVRERMTMQMSDDELRQRAAQIIVNDDETSLIRSVLALLKNEI